MAQTTIAVETATRDKIKKIMADLGEPTADAVLNRLIFEHDCSIALARLDADDSERAEYRREAQELAELDVQVTE